MGELKKYIDSDMQRRIDLAWVASATLRETFKEKSALEATVGATMRPTSLMQPKGTGSEADSAEKMFMGLWIEAATQVRAARDPITRVAPR